MTLSLTFRNVYRLALAGFVTLAALVALGSASAVAAGTWGGLEHFSGKGSNGKGKPFSFSLGTVAFGVDRKDNSIYVVDEPEEQSTEYRIQKYGEKGEFLAQRMINPGNPATGEEVEGVAIDPEQGRVYVMTVSTRTGTLDSGSTVAETVYAFSTEPKGSELVPATGTKAEGVLATPEELGSNSEEPGRALLTPSGLAVDPLSHEVVVLGRVDEGGGAMHVALDRIGEKGGLQKTYVDPTRATEEELTANSPVISGRGNVYYQVEGGVFEVPSGSSAAPTLLFEPHTRTGLSENAFEVELVKPEESGQGAGLSIAPETGSGTLYSIDEINEVFKEGSSEGKLAEGFPGVLGVGYTEPSPEVSVLSEFGWTGGAKGEKGTCSVSFGGPTYTMVAAGGNHTVFVLSPARDEVLEFGEGGKGCPTATAKPVEAKLEGFTVKEVETSQKVTLSANVLDANVLSTEWQFGDGTSEKTVVPTGEELQRAETTHQFKKDGKLEVVAKIHTDDLASPNFEVKGVVTVIGPVITKEPQGQTVAEGGNATFEATATGEPAPTVQWQVSDEGKVWTNVEGATSSKLTITGVTLADNGHEYRALFKNECASKRTCTAITGSATLKVTSEPKEPKVTENPSNQTVTEGEPARFKATASGNPTPEIQWQVSTDKGTTWTNVGSATKEELTIASTKVSENGNEYRAVFTNGVGKPADTSAAILTVNAKSEAPTVVEQPKNVTVVEEEPARFKATASGSPAPTVQWEVSTDKGATWSPVPGATHEELAITKTKLAENGDELRAVFKNSAGEATSGPAMLTVEKAAPAVTLQPKSVAVTEGEAAVFNAEASGRAPLEVHWQVSTDKGATWTIVSGVTTDELKITDAKSSENGDEFRAVFKNSLGEATSEPAVLTVGNSQAPAITEQPKSISVTEGEAATFKAEASGRPTPEVQWQVSKNGGTTWENDPGATSNELTVEATSSNNGYEYRAVFKNSAGEATSEPAKLTVHGQPPSITEQPKSVTVAEGEGVSFRATAVGKPTPTVQWEVSTNKGATWSEIKEGTSDELTLASTFGAENEYEYKAVFTNEGGKAETNPATLTVKSGATIREQPNNVTVTEGETATFKASANGFPAPGVQWYVQPKGSEVWVEVAGEAGTSNELKIPNTTLAESGNVYQAVFTAQIGKPAESTAVTLTVNKKGVATAVTEAKQNVLHAQEANVKPAAALASTSLAVSNKGVVVLEVTCPATESICSGTATLRTLTAVTAGTGKKRRGKTKRSILTLASGAFVVEGGHVKAVTLHLSSAARTLIGRLHTLRARAIVVARDPNGARNTTDLIVTLHSVKPKHRR